jgi:hypothetical protein
MNYRTKAARKQGTRSKPTKKHHLKKKPPVRKPYVKKSKQTVAHRFSALSPPTIGINYSVVDDEYTRPVKLTQKKSKKYHKSFLILLLHILATYKRINPQLIPPETRQSPPKQRTTGRAYTLALKSKPGDFCSGRTDCGYYPRTEMPQVDNSKDEEKFKKSLNSNGYKIKLVKEFDFKQFPKPTQREISLAKVGGICGHKSLKGENPIILLKVRFEIAGKIETKYAIIDGHHRSVALSTPGCGVGSKAPALVVRSPNILKVPDGVSNPTPTINSGLDLEFTRLRNVIPASLMKGYTF